MGELTNVFSHFETGDLIVLFLGNISVVGAENTDLVGDTSFLSFLKTPLSLVATKCDSSNVRSTFGGMNRQSAPAEIR
jgi:hypothetical protein